jgi:hypothetical protein
MNCDWVIGTRMAHWRRIPISTAYGDPAQKPRTIFVMSEHLTNFNDHILRCLGPSERVVLILGDQDLTIPRQMDKRYAYKLPSGIFHPTGPTSHNFRYSIWQSWLNDPRIVHIFAEHLDELNHTKVSPMPTGLNPEEPQAQYFMSLSVNQILQLEATPIMDRPLKMRFTNRLRDGPQWEMRHQTHQACSSTWKNYCVTGPPSEGASFMQDVGLDPNPMAWSALLAGSIPIIARFPGDIVYNDLPVVLVDDLPSPSLTMHNLSRWRVHFASFFEGEKRRQVVEKLMSSYWWSKVASKIVETRRDSCGNHSELSSA